MGIMFLSFLNVAARASARDIFIGAQRTRLSRTGAAIVP
jgi:hypothetical protein